MFNRNKHAGADRTDTVIGEGTRIEGVLVSAASLHIQGNLQGKIECAGDVTVAAGSVVHGDIAARHVVNAGTIAGAVHAEGALRITASGKLYGDIVVQSIVVENGGLLQGICMMDSNDPAGDGSLDHDQKDKDNVKMLQYG